MRIFVSMKGTAMSKAKAAMEAAVAGPYRPGRRGLRSTAGGMPDHSSITAAAAFFQGKRPSVVAEPLPGAEDSVEGARCQGRKVGKETDEGLILGQYAFHPGLLQHDLRDKYAVRVLGEAPGRAPGHEMRNSDREEQRAPVPKIGVAPEELQGRSDYSRSLLSRNVGRARPTGPERHPFSSGRP